MDRVREAMELAIKERWDVPPPPASLDRPPQPVRRTPPAEPARTPHIAVDEPADHTATAQLAPLRPAPARAPSRRPVLHSIRTENVPAETFARNRVVAADKDSRERESYCLLQAAVCERLDTLGHVLGVTGPRRATGKTLTAANLAASLVLDAHRPTVLVDLDLRAPGVAKLFGIDAKPGLEECLFNGASPADALFSPSIEGLAVLPSRRGSRSVPQVLKSPNLKALLAQIRASWPDAVVVLDLPAVSGSVDTGVLGGLVDAVLLVVEDGVTREADYRRVVSGFGRAKIVGTVLNKAAPSA